MECAFCGARLEDPDRCRECGRDQPAVAPARPVPRGLRADPAGLPIGLLAAGAFLWVLGFSLSDVAPGIAPAVGIVGFFVLAAAFFVPLVMILRRVDALAKRR